MERIISAREIQRRYKELIEEAEKERRPIFLGSHNRVRAVLLDIATFKELQEQAGERKKTEKWSVTEKKLDAIAGEGNTDVSLSDFITRDRHAH